MRLEIIERMATVSTAAFGLVAALAWNSAVQELFKFLFPDQQGVTAKFVYAVSVTIIVILVTWQIGRIANRAKAEKKSSKH